MADTIQFDRNRSSRPDCLRVEDLLADAVDGLLSESGQADFDRHIAGCDACSGLLADAQRGAAWLEMLKTPRPEPSVRLLERILAQTEYAENSGIGQSAETAAHPAPADRIAAIPLLDSHFDPQRSAPTLQPAAGAWPAKLLPFRPRPQQPAFVDWKRVNRVLFEPRLAMTAAMAFFSIALTLNLAGVHVDQLHARDLKPANLRRSYYEASASAIRHYDNLRVVHVLESRVDDLRESSGVDRQLPGEPGTSSDIPESRRDQPASPPPAQPGTPRQPNGNPSRPEDAPAKDSRPEGPGMSQRQPILPEPRLVPVAWKAQNAPAHVASHHAGHDSGGLA